MKKYLGKLKSGIIRLGHLLVFHQVRLRFITAVPVYVYFAQILAVVVAFVIIPWEGAEFLFYLLGYLVLISTHEFGHYFLVRLYQKEDAEIYVGVFHGVCTYDGVDEDERTLDDDIEESVIAWGGVLAQVMLFVPAALVLDSMSEPESAVLYPLLQVLTGYNLLMIAFNLLPLPGLDGSTAWKLFPMWISRWRFNRRMRSSMSRPEKKEKKAGEKRPDAVVEEFIERMKQNRDGGDS